MSRANIQEAKCMLVVGATAGIGRALALAIHGLPSKPVVVVAGRRQERLDELTKQSERIKSVRVDLTSSRDSLKTFANEIIAKYPDVSDLTVFFEVFTQSYRRLLQLDTIILSSGIQHIFDFKKPEDIDLDCE